MSKTLRKGLCGGVLRLTAFQHCRRGTALVEFAFAAPIMVLLTLGSFDLGRAVWFDITLQHAAKEAARYASLRGSESLSPASESDVEAFVLDRAAGLPAEGLVITVSWSPDSGPGSTVQVNLSYSYELLLQGFLHIAPLQLEGSASRIIL